MQIPKIQNGKYNTSFGAGNVILKRITAEDILKYDTIKRIAEEDNLDIIISKGNEPKQPFIGDYYIVTALKNINQYPFSIQGLGCAIVRKKNKAEEVSNKIYNATIQSVENLATNIKQRTGTMPNFLQYLKK